MSVRRSQKLTTRPTTRGTAPGTPDDGARTEISFLEMFLSLSTALDLVNPRLGDHHKLTCYIASKIAETVGVAETDYNNLFASALIHDIGAASMVDRLKLLDFEETQPHDHAHMGALLLDMIDLLKVNAPVVKHHHVRWQDGRGQEKDGEAVSPLSHIIHLADRIAVQIDHDMPILSKAKHIREKVQEFSGPYFTPLYAEAFTDLSHNHGFWLNMDGAFLDDTVSSASHLRDMTLDVNELTQLAKVYAFIIDSRSRFTASHSSGVAAVAERLALTMGLDDCTAQRIKVAGYLHDIGKLSTPNEILEKNGPLNDEERLIIKGHSFYTEKILSQVRGLERIATWAAQHHEFLDGSGYPYGLRADELSLESRILTVADIFTALTETRPYREGMDYAKALKILESMSKKGQIDQTVFDVLVDNWAAVDSSRANAQDEDDVKRLEFWERVRVSFGASTQAYS